MKIAVYTCMKNEEANVEDWLDSCSDADHIVALDTGSTDHTSVLLRNLHSSSSYKSVLWPLSASIQPFRFDVALNTALALIPPDVDVCVQLSADERLSRGWRPALEQAVKTHLGYWVERKTSGVPFKVHYQYAFSPELTFWHDRIHSRHGYAWRFPFHEGLYPAHGLTERSTTVTTLKITQVQQKTVNRLERDGLLAAAARAEFPHDARMCFYVGRQLMYVGEYREAVAELDRYPALVKMRGYEVPSEAAWWADAVAQCWRAIAAGGK